MGVVRVGWGAPAPSGTVPSFLLSPVPLGLGSDYSPLHSAAGGRGLREPVCYRLTAFAMSLRLSFIASPPFVL
eukprot:scaffold198199_cov31-Tisochrysis_lutea.AAC.2